MRSIHVLAALALLAGCAAGAPPALTRCEAPRPTVCTMQYQPVCGRLIAGGRGQYSSPCNACADDRVAAYEPGDCPEAS